MNSDIIDQHKNRITAGTVFWVTLGSLIYLLSAILLLGFKTEQLSLIILFNVLYYISYSTRRFVLGFLIFIIFWIIFDFMKAIPNYTVNAIHIKDLYLREKLYFGINEMGEVLSPNEYANKHSNTVLDITAGLFYLNWVPVPLMFAFFLFRKNKSLFLQFSLSFLFVNLIGFAVYYLYPAAPPWYVKECGFDLKLNTPGHTAALSRFDEFFGVKIFDSIYSKSSNVFAAMPSLHASYPVIVFYYGLKSKLGLINAFFFIFMLGIWFAAVYTGHHYVLDVLAGIACAIIGLAIFQRILMKRKWFKQFLAKYQNVITQNSYAHDRKYEVGSVPTPPNNLH